MKQINRPFCGIIGVLNHDISPMWGRLGRGCAIIKSLEGPRPAGLAAPCLFVKSPGTATYASTYTKAHLNARAGLNRHASH